MVIFLLMLEKVVADPGHLFLSDRRGLLNNSVGILFVPRLSYSSASVVAGWTLLVHS